MTDAIPRPERSEFAEFYAGYVDAVPGGDVRALLREQGAALQASLAAVPDTRAGHRYAEDKWSVREVVGHLVDAERIFTYRALRIARGDATPLPGFDENSYVQAAGSDARTMRDLLAELAAVRASSVMLFDSLDGAAWSRMGTASGQPISVRALAYITVGHVAHHLRILRERYDVG